MLAKMRDGAKGWVAKILLGLLVVAFGIWGIGDIFRTRTNTTVAEIGERKIEGPEFKREFDQLRERFGRQTGSEALPQDQAFAFGLDRVALNQMISRTVLEVEADRLGLTVSDRTLVDSIQSFDAFQGPTGNFDPTTYRETLARAGMTTQMFETSMAQEITTMQLVETAMSGIETPRALAEWLFRLQGERRRVTYLSVPAEAVVDLPAPEDSVLMELHEVESPRFTAPEVRDLTYLLITPEDLLDEVEVSDEQITEVYEFNQAQYNQPERRSVRQLSFATREEAEAAAAKATDLLSFTEVALDSGFSPTELELGVLSEEQFPDEGIGAAAFALDAPGVTGVVESLLGYAIIAVDEIQPATATPLEEVADTLRRDIALGQAQDALYDLVTAVEDKRAAGDTLEEIGTALSLPIRSVQNISRSGQNIDGNEPEGGAVAGDIITQAFESDVGIENDFREIEGGGYFVTRVDAITPSSLKPFETVRGDVLGLWEERERVKALVALGESLAQRAKGGDPLQSLSAEVQGKVVTPVDPIGRGSVDDALTADLVRDLFRAQPGAIVQGAGQGQRSYVIATVEEIVPTDETQLDAAVASIRQSLAPTMAEEISEQLVVALRDDIGVEINERAIALALGQDNPQGTR